jgi:hypothetical protein
MKLSKRFKRLLSSMGILALIAGVALVTLGVLLKSKPAFYAAAHVDAGSERVADSAACERNFLFLVNAFSSGDPTWNAIFTDRQINSYFQEDYEKVGGDQNLPEGFSAPRVEMEDGIFRLGCQYGWGPWKTVLSLELKVWLIADDVNLIGVEIVRFRAGALSVSPRWMMESITEAIRKRDADVTWYRRDGHPVGVFCLQANQLRPTHQIQRLDILQDKLVLVGQSKVSR